MAHATEIEAGMTMRESEPLIEDDSDDWKCLDVGVFANGSRTNLNEPCRLYVIAVDAVRL
jgi:hypothetical protein